MNEAEATLLRIIEACRAQLQELARAPEGEARVRHRAVVLEDLLHGLAASFAPLGKSAVEPSLRTKARELAEAVALWSKSEIRAELHLVALGEGWACAGCGANTPAAAAVTALGGDKAEVRLVCSRCQAATGLTPKGRLAFERLFGHLVKPGWNPTMNGFRYRGAG
jgi:hypothetical protein